VTRAKLDTVHAASLGQRQLDPRGNYSVAAYYDSHIVKRSARIEDGLEKFRCNLGVDPNAGFDKFTQCHLLLNDHNSSGSGARQFSCSSNYLFYCFRQLLRRTRQQARLAYPDQYPSDFRLKRCDGNDQDANQEALVKMLQSREGELPDNQIQDKDARHQNKYDPPEQPLAPRTFEEIYNPVNHQPDEKQLYYNDPPIIVIGHSVEVINERSHKSNSFYTFSGTRPAFGVMVFFCL
jgi:hypothetical protein